ncbi:MAG: folylpolyglutamate synthase/dihydrofolate synthase family protein [Flavobacteriales bacterium]
MEYQRACELLYEQLPIYQRQGGLAYKADLGNIEALCAHFGNPQKAFPSIHIAGTNGKGSTAHLLASILQEAGYKTGLHTQPHFLDLRERIRVNGIPCTKRFIAQKVEAYWQSDSGIAPSFFELLLAFAFTYFAKEEKVDIAVLETGLGGRLDATNIVRPELSVITNIGHDHMQFLGPDLPSIAREKAGIIKAGIPVLLGNIPEEALPAIEERAREMNAPLIHSSTYGGKIPESDLRGSFQEENIRTTLTAIERLQEEGWELPEEAVKRGIARVIPNTGFMGRWQVVRKEPLVIADMGHNREALRSITRSLEEEEYRKLHFVFGSVNDKEWDEALAEIPEGSSFYPCQPEVPRAMPVEELNLKLQERGIPSKPYGSVMDAYRAALKQAKEADLVLIGGSAFVVADLLEKEGKRLAEE